MEYQVVVVAALSTVGLPDFMSGGQSLAEKVAMAMRQGWQPLGGVAVGQDEKQQKPYLLQAMVRKK